MGKRRVRIAGALVLAAVAGLIVYGFLPKPQVVDVAAVGRGPLQVTLEEEGKTRVRDRFTVAAPTGGVVSRIQLQPGAAVQPGTVLALIRPMRSPLLDPQARAGAEASLDAALDARRQAEAAVARSGALVEGARKGFERTEALVRAGAATRQQLDEATVELRAREGELASARFAAQVAAHQAESARALLGTFGPGGGGAGAGLPVTSPIAGHVLKVLQESEGPVAVGAPLVELGDVEALEVVADVLTRDAVRIRPGMRAVLAGWGGEPPLESKVREVEPSAFTHTSALGVQEQRVNVVLDLAGGAARRPRLGDGYAVEVRFILHEAADVLKVSRSALFRRAEGWAAFAVRSGRARLEPVEVGHLGSAEAEVLGGLREGDTVILHPEDAVRDGTAVRPAPGGPRAPPAPAAGAAPAAR